MSINHLAKLKQLMAERYGSLKAQLAYRLGDASDMAGDALHDAFISLAQHQEPERIKHPHTYLLTSALHSAIDQIRSDARLLSTDEIDALFELPDPSAQPDEQLQVRQHLQQLLAVLDTLSDRQRALLIDYRVHGVSSAELARKWNISSSMVRREIRLAHYICQQAIKPSITQLPESTPGHDGA